MRLLRVLLTVTAACAVLGACGSAATPTSPDGVQPAQSGMMGTGARTEP